MVQDHNRLVVGQQDIAFQRFKIIEPYIYGTSNLMCISKQHSISQSTLTRWVAKYKKIGLAGLSTKQRKDLGDKQILPLLNFAIEALVLHQPHLSMASIHRKVCKFALSRKIRAPSYTYIRNQITNIPEDLKTLAHHGNKKYDDIYELIFLRNAKHANDIWQADHTLLDIITIDEHQEEKRPWLTIIIDDKSRAIAGYYLTYSAPSALNTSLALRQAIWRKQNENWPVCGIPKILYTDHGSDFTSKHIEQVCADLKMELIFSLVGKPRGRGKVERFFETINQLLLIDLPGYTKGKRDKRPLLTIDNLEMLIKKFLINKYNHTTHSALGISPIESWEVSGFLPQLPTSFEQLDLLLLTVAKPRKVRNTGISFSSLNYQSPMLAAYVGEAVVIRYDPRDLTEIRVFYNNIFLCIAICPKLSEVTVSLNELQKARRLRKVELRNRIKEHRELIDILLEKPAPLPTVKMKSTKPQPSTKSTLKLYENE